MRALSTQSQLAVDRAANKTGYFEQASSKSRYRSRQKNTRYTERTLPKLINNNSNRQQMQITDEDNFFTTHSLNLKCL